MMEFLHMGGYAGYVWSSYAIVVTVLIWNVVSSRRRHKNILKRLKQLHSETNNS